MNCLNSRKFNGGLIRLIFLCGTVIVGSLSVWFWVIKDLKVISRFGETKFYWELTKPEPFYTKYMKAVFDKAYFDVFNDHNQILDLYDMLITSKKLDDSPKILVLVDTHPDLHFDNTAIDTGLEGIGNWVNALITKTIKDKRGAIDEIYWLIPEEWESNESSKNDAASVYFPPEQRTILLQADQEFGVDPKTGRISFFDPLPKGSHIVKFHMRTLKQMPSFVGVQKQVVLTIDADFFDFNGFEQGYNFKIVHSNSGTLNRDLNAFVTRMFDIGLRPVLVGCSRSLEYSAGMSKYIEIFFRNIGLHSQNGADYMVMYKHNNTQMGEYSGRQGENKVREDLPDSQDIYDLQTTDILYGGFDYLIDVSTENFERSKAEDMLMRNKSITRDEALDILKKFAELHGRKGKVINLPPRTSYLF